MSEVVYGPPKVVLSDIYQITPDALEQIALYIEQRGLRTPVSNIVGFQQFAAINATPVLTIESTASTTYTDLATTGPTLTGIANGNFLVLFGCRADPGGSTSAARMSISPNGAAASDNNSCSSDSQNLIAGMSIMRAFTVQLTTTAAGGNTLQAKYRVTGATTGNFGQRWLVALRYANI
jgi:hypothetical protein